MAKVIKAFRDKITWVAYAVGSDYEGGRVDELAALGYVVGASAPVQVDEEPQEPQEAPTEAPSTDYSGKTKAQLVELCHEREIDVPKNATKAILIDLLRG